MIVQIETTGTVKHTIASYLCSYLDEPMLIVHLHFLKVYLLTWWDQHFTWHKHIDPETKTPGFLTPHMAVHYFVKHTDFE